MSLLALNLCLYTIHHPLCNGIGCDCVNDYMNDAYEELAKKEGQSKAQYIIEVILSFEKSNICKGCFMKLFKCVWAINDSKNGKFSLIRGVLGYGIC